MMVLSTVRLAIAAHQAAPATRARGAYFCLSSNSSALSRFPFSQRLQRSSTSSAGISCKQDQPITLAISFSAFWRALSFSPCARFLSVATSVEGVLTRLLKRVRGSFLSGVPGTFCPGSEDKLSSVGLGSTPDKMSSVRSTKRGKYTFEQPRRCITLMQPAALSCLIALLTVRSSIPRRSAIVFWLGHAPPLTLFTQLKISNPTNRAAAVNFPLRRRSSPACSLARVNAL